MGLRFFCYGKAPRFSSYSKSNSSLYKSHEKCNTALYFAHSFACPCFGWRRYQPKRLRIPPQLSSKQHDSPRLRRSINEEYAIISLDIMQDPCMPIPRPHIVHRPRNVIIPRNGLDENTETIQNEITKQRNTQDNDNSMSACI